MKNFSSNPGALMVRSTVEVWMLLDCSTRLGSTRAVPLGLNYASTMPQLGLLN